MQLNGRHLTFAGSPSSRFLRTCAQEDDFSVDYLLVHFLRNSLLMSRGLDYGSFVSYQNLP